MYKGLLCVLLMAFGGCQSSYYFVPLSRKTLHKVFAHQAFKPVANTLSLPDGPLHYMSIGSPSKEYMLFMIHGSPGLWNNYLDYFRDDFLLDNFLIISPDRRGYGQSGDRGVNSIAREARIFGRIIARYPQQVLVVGHSYGGPVAMQLQLQYPDRVAGTLLIAPALSPAFEQGGRWRYLLKLPIVAHLMPSGLSVSNEEMIHLRRGLRKLDAQYRGITQPVYYIHGTWDWLVPYANMAYVEQKLAHAPLTTVTLRGADHFIPWTRYDEVIAGIKHLYGQVTE